MPCTTARAHGNVSITPAVLRSSLCNLRVLNYNGPRSFRGERKDKSTISVSMRESSVQQVGVVSAEFPRHFLALLRCSHDAGPLILAAELQSGAVGLVQARLRCAVCDAEYRIEDGIANLMSDPLTSEDQYEMAIRDSQHSSLPPDRFVPPASGWRSKLSDLLEIPHHLSELQPRGCKVLEIGCGDGRFTMLMAQMGATVLAVDFSIDSLRTLASWLPSGIAPTAYQLPYGCSPSDLRGRVALVRADASHFHVAPRSFDRALSTTPLDSLEERMAMYRTIAKALTDDGRYVGSVENDDLTRRLLGLPLARRYSSGIFIEHFDVGKLRREVSPYFSRLRIRPIRPRLPFIHRLPSNWVLYLSHLATATPVLRHLGEILLFRAERPVRQPIEGIRRPGSKLAKRLFRWYMRKIGKPPLWEENEPV